MSIPSRLAPLLLLLLASGSAEDHWESQNPRSDFLELGAVHFADGKVGYVAGYSGALLRSPDGGASWVTVPRATRRILRSLHFTDPLTGIAVGDSGALIRTVDGGLSWAPVSIPIRENLAGINFPEPAVGFVFGSSGSILKTRDGGATWKSVRPGPGTALQSLSFPDARTGFATGNGPFLLKTVDGGESWDSHPIDPVNKQDGIGRIISSHFPDSKTGYLSVLETHLTGSGKHVFPIYLRYYFKTVNGGVTWNTSPPEGTPFPGQYLEDGMAFSLFQGRMHASKDRGESWTPMAAFTPAPNTFWSPIAFHFSNPDTGAVLGYNGAMFWTTDGGKTWKPAQVAMAGSESIISSDILLSVHFSDPVAGYAVGGGAGEDAPHGRILKTLDGGTNWTRVTSPSPYPLHAVHFPDPLHGTVAGGMHASASDSRPALYRTVDGGLTWQDKSASADRALEALHFPTSLKGFAVGRGGAIHVTADGGDTWMKSESGDPSDLFTVQFLDGQTGFAGGGSEPDLSVLLGTTDGGRSWRRLMADSNSSPITSMQFFSARSGCILRGGILYRTSDGGSTWTEESRIPEVTAFRFSSPDTGFAVGQGLFKTVDGGKTWSSQSIGGYPLMALAMPDARTAYAVGVNMQIMKMQSFPATRVGAKTGRPPMTSLGLLPGGKVWFELERPSHVAARVFDARGRMRVELLRRVHGAGRHMLAVPAAPCGASACFLDFRADGFRKTLPIMSDPAGRP